MRLNEILQKTFFVCVIDCSSDCRSFYLWIKSICDVIWEVTAYGGAHSVFLDRPLPHVNIYRLFSNCAESKKYVFCRCSYVTKSTGWSNATQNGRPLIGAYSFCPSISQVFQEDITYCDYSSEIEDLSWVVSWDHQFLNEFNKVLFSEPLAS